jgi:heterodisulfide reductase subunit A2
MSTVTESKSRISEGTGRVLTLPSHDLVLASGYDCVVDEDKCISCGSCVSVCAYGAVELRDTQQGKKAAVNPVLCKGDGLCSTKCPRGAISLKHFTDEDIFSQIDAAIEEEEVPSRYISPIPA